MTAPISSRAVRLFSGFRHSQIETRGFRHGVVSAIRAAHSQVVSGKPLVAGKRQATRMVCGLSRGQATSRSVSGVMRSVKRLIEMGSIAEMVHCGTSVYQLGRLR